VTVLPLSVSVTFGPFVPPPGMFVAAETPARSNPQSTPMILRQHFTSRRLESQAQTHPADKLLLITKVAHLTPPCHPYFW
jgi:hypothetical protein